jgi:glycosyltransferase involved in cell wall biosynthesis
LKKRKNTNIIFNKSLFIEPIWILRKLGLFKNINFIYFAHGGSSDFRNFYLSRKLTAHRVKMIFEAFDKVICLYDDEKNYPKQVKREKLFFIPNPLPFEPSDIDFNQKENIVLSLGRVTKEKGIDTLIKAWSILGDKTKDWQLQIVGDGKDKKEFIELAKKLKIPNIEFKDAISDVKPLYEKAKIFVIPSLFEGMPMTILEAMACKCAVISSKTAGGKQLIEDKKNGLLFDISNEVQLSEKILYLIRNKNKMQNIAYNGFESVQKYNIENISKRWENVFE